MLDPATLHRLATRVLPSGLRTQQVIGMPADESALAALLLPLRHVHRGSLWFRLAEETRAALAADPLACLQEAVVAREGLGRRRARMAYAPWTAVTASPPPVYATHSIDERVRLWLIPATGVLVYAWDDRGMRQRRATRWEG